MRLNSLVSLGMATGSSLRPAILLNKQALFEKGAKLVEMSRNRPVPIGASLFIVIEHRAPTSSVGREFDFEIGSVFVPIKLYPPRSDRGPMWNRTSVGHERPESINRGKNRSRLNRRRAPSAPIEGQKQKRGTALQGWNQPLRNGQMGNSKLHTPSYTPGRD